VRDYDREENTIDEYIFKLKFIFFNDIEKVEEESQANVTAEYLGILSSVGIVGFSTAIYYRDAIQIAVDYPIVVGVSAFLGFCMFVASNKGHYELAYNDLNGSCNKYRRFEYAEDVKE